MKMFTKSRLMAVIATSAALSMALAGCSNPTADSSSESDTGAQDYWPTATQKLDGVELTMWVAQNSNKIPVKVVSDFEKATGATVKLETIPDPYEQNVQTKTTTGDTPDLAFWQPTQSMLAGFIAQDKLQKLDNAPWVDNYTDGIADAGGVVDGTRYAALVSTPPVMGVFYNKKVFEKAGITDIPKGWDGYVEAAKKIKDADIDGVESPLFEMGGSQWGTQYSVQIQLAEAAQDGLWDRVNSLFNQIAALASNDKAALDETIGFFPLSSEGNIGTVIPEQNNSVVAFKTGDSKKEAAARQFINYWMTEDYATFVKDQGIVSVIKGVDTPDNVPQALLDSADSIKDSVGSMQSLAVANPDLYINLADMINGTKSPEDVAKATQDQFAQLAKAQGVQGF